MQNDPTSTEDHRTNRVPFDYKLLVDPAVTRSAQKKVYRYNGLIPDDPHQPLVTLRDPRTQRQCPIGGNRPVMVLPVPRMTIDANFVGNPPAVEVTITNVNDNVDEYFLKDMILKCGHYEDIRIYYHPLTRKHLGVARVTFKTPGGARKCIDSYNGKSVMGNPLVVFYDPLGVLCKQVQEDLINPRVAKKPPSTPPAPISAYDAYVHPPSTVVRPPMASLESTKSSEYPEYPGFYQDTQSQMPFSEYGDSYAAYYPRYDEVRDPRRLYPPVDVDQRYPHANIPYGSEVPIRPDRHERDVYAPPERCLERNDDYNGRGRSSYKDVGDSKKSEKRYDFYERRDERENYSKRSRSQSSSEPPYRDRKRSKTSEYYNESRESYGKHRNGYNRSSNKRFEESPSQYSNNPYNRNSGPRTPDASSQHRSYEPKSSKPHYNSNFQQNSSNNNKNEIMIPCDENWDDDDGPQTSTQQTSAGINACSNSKQGFLIKCDENWDDDDDNASAQMTAKPNSPKPFNAANAQPTLIDCENWDDEDESTSQPQKPNVEATNQYYPKINSHHKNGSDGMHHYPKPPRTPPETAPTLKNQEILIHCSEDWGDEPTMESNPIVDASKAPANDEQATVKKTKYSSLEKQALRAAKLKAKEEKLKFRAEKEKIRALREEKRRRKQALREGAAMEEQSSVTESSSALDETIC